MNGNAVTKAPKTHSGRRTLTVPSNLADALEHHLYSFVAPDPEALVFTGEQGGPLALCVLDRAWQRARSSIGRPDLRLHDYADVRVMPMFPRTSSSPVVSAQKLSA
jgi:hypothetical protein